MLRGGEGRGAIILRTYAGGGGGSMESVRVRTRGEGGSEIGDFTAYVLYGCPLIFLFFLEKQTSP